MNISLLAALLLMCLSNFRAISNVLTRISRLHDLSRSCGKTYVRSVKKALVGITLIVKIYCQCCVVSVPLIMLRCDNATCCIWRGFQTMINISFIVTVIVIVIVKCVEAVTPTTCSCNIIVNVITLDVILILESSQLLSQTLWHFLKNICSLYKNIHSNHVYKQTYSGC